MTSRWCVLLAVLSWAEFHQGPSFTNAQAYTLASRNAHNLFNAIYGIHEERLGPTSPFDRKDPPRPFGKYDSKPTNQHAPKRDFERGATTGEKSGPVGPKTMKEPLGSFNPNYHQSRSGGGYNTGSYSHSLPHMTPYLGASQGKPPFPRVTHPNSAANDDIQLHIHYTDGPSPPLFPTSYQPRLPQPKTYSPPLPRPVNRESDLPVHGAMRGVPVKYNEQVPPNTLNTNIPYPFLPPMPSSVPIPTSRPAVSEVPQNSPYITFVDMPRQEPAPYNGIENTGTEMSGFNNPGPGFRPLSKDEKSGTHNFGTLPPPLPSPNYDRSPQDTSAYIVEDYSDDSPKGSPGYDEYSKSSKWQDRYQELLPQEYEEMHRKLPNDAAIDPSAVTSGNFQLSNRDIINRMNTFKSPFNFDGNLQSQSRHDNGNINEAGRQLPSVYQNIPIPGNGFQFPNQNVLNPMATFQNANGNSKNVNRNVFNPNGHLQNHNGNVQDVNRNIQNQNGKKQSPSGPSPYLTLNTQGIGQSSFPQYPLINLVPQYVNYPKNTNEESLNKFNQGINFPIAGAGKPFVPSTNSMIKPTPVTDLQELAKQRDALSKSFMGSMNRQSPLHPIAGAGKPFVPITKGIIKPTPVTDLQELAKQRDALSKSFMRAMKAKFGNDKPSKPQEVVHVAPGLPKHKPVDMGAKAPALTSGLRNSQQSKTRFLNVNKMFQNPSGNVQNFRTQNQNSPFATKSSAVETKGSENSNRKSRGRGQNNLRNRNMIAQRMRENFRRKFRQSGSKSTSFEDAENADADEVIIQSSGDDDEENSAFKLLPNEASEQVDSEKVMANKKTVKESNAKSGPDLKETTTDSIPAECKDMAMKDPEGKMTPAMRAVMCRLYKGWSDDMKAGASWTPSHKQAQWFESLGSERGDSPQRTKRQAVNKALRQEYRTLTDEQRQLFHDVMNQLKEDSLDGLSKYDIFVNFHRASMAPGAHFGPAFLPWHREFLLRLGSKNQPAIKSM